MCKCLFSLQCKVTFMLACGRVNQLCSDLGILKLVSSSQLIRKNKQMKIENKFEMLREQTKSAALDFCENALNFREKKKKCKENIRKQNASRKTRKEQNFEKNCACQKLTCPALTWCFCRVCSAKTKTDFCLLLLLLFCDCFQQKDNSCHRIPTIFIRDDDDNVTHVPPTNHKAGCAHTTDEGKYVGSFHPADTGLSC